MQTTLKLLNTYKQTVNKTPAKTKNNSSENNSTNTSSSQQENNSIKSSKRYHIFLMVFVYSSA